MSESAIEIICGKLTKCPQARFTRTDDSIVVMPCNESGFEVALIKRGGGYTVAFDGWHEAFEDQRMH